MTIRIYAYAKKNVIESKDVVDACQKLGIMGKHNSLASLTDAEAVMLDKYFSESSSKSTTTVPFVDDSNKIEMVRPTSSPSPVSKVPVIKIDRPRRIAELGRVKPASSENDSSVESESESADKTWNEADKTQDFQDTADTKEVRDEQGVQDAVVTSDSSLEKADSSDFPSDDKDVAKEISVLESLEVATDSDDKSSNSVQDAVVESDNKSEQSSVKASDNVEAQDVVQKSMPLSDSAVCEPTNKVDSPVVSDNVNDGDDSQKLVSSSSETVVEISPDSSEKESTEKAEDGAQQVESKETSPNKDVEGVITTSSENVPKITETVKIVDGSNTSSGTIVGSKVDEKVVETQERNQPRNTSVTTGSQVNRRNNSLREAIERRDGQRRGKDNKRGGKQEPPRPPKPVVLAPPTPPFMGSADSSRSQILEEMKRPPMITPPRGDKLRVVGSPVHKNKPSDNSSSSQRQVRPSVALHLAPMPTQPAKPVRKEVKETAQTPIMHLPPEALRAAARGGSRPLMEHIRDLEERSHNKGEQGSGRGRNRDDRRNNNGNGNRDVSSNRDFGADDRRSANRGTMNKIDVGSPDFSGANNNRRKKTSKERTETEGREDVRVVNKRRQGNGSDFKHFRDDDSGDFQYASRQRRNRKDKNASSNVTAPRRSDVAIEIPCTVKQFAETTGISVASVIKKLMELGYMLTINHSMDAEIVELLIVALELKATIKQEATLEEQYVDKAYEQDDPPESLKSRAPVVTFLGHVDHGKTSLLDRILNLHVVSGEKGGITQHIRAYRVSTERGDVTFVDTPGHEAFTEMRARGANCTDIAVLVVAADDGVMPQTEEAISHAKAAGVPIVVALNKMDLPGVNKDKVIQELASNDLMPSEWGGDVEIVETSAVTGMGVDNLLDTLLMVAELHELKANPDRMATGVVLESSLQAREGVVCKALVQNGTLRNGDVILCGSSYGSVRSMTDTLDSHKRITEAGPSVPVTLTGLDVAPDAGSKFVVLDDISVARQIAEERAKRVRDVELAGAPAHMTLENLFERMNTAKSQQILNVIIRADARGSIEAIRKEMGKLDHPEVKVKILQASVGGVTEADVHLADASDAIIVGFNVVPDESARALAEVKKVQVRRYDVIYKLTEDIKAALQGMLKPIEQVKELGRALVQRAFNISRVGVIAGCRVLHGVIERDCQIRVIRDSRIIGEYHLDTLKREKDDVKEVRDGYECGMKLKNFNDIKEGDILEAYKIEEVARTFEE